MNAITKPNLRCPSCKRAKMDLVELPTLAVWRCPACTIEYPAAVRAAAEPKPLEPEYEAANFVIDKINQTQQEDPVHFSAVVTRLIIEAVADANNWDVDEALSRMAEALVWSIELEDVPFHGANSIN